MIVFVYVYVVWCGVFEIIWYYFVIEVGFD